VLHTVSSERRWGRALSKVALITGITGQDGSYLAEQLIQKGYEVHGLVRRASTFNTSRLENIYRSTEDPQSVQLHYIDTFDSLHMYSLIEKISPNEIYNLMALSHVAQSFDQPEYAAETAGLGLLRILEIVRSLKLDTKIYQASTSELFGSTPPPQNESSPFDPRSPYAAAKRYAHDIARIYRDAFGIFVSTGILFNHESPRRSRTFVTRKISAGVAEIVHGTRKTITLGNLEAKRDWGFAPEYTEAMWKIMQLDHPTDLVIATGVQFSVRDFCEFAFSHANLEWGKYVKVSDQFMRPLEVESLCGDSSRAASEIGWAPKVLAPELASIMVDADLDRKTFTF
jgi:GDPmannose 4,6-dehydratase